MFSIEDEFDHTLITIVDNENKREDVQVIMDQHAVFLRQYNEKTHLYEVIELSPAMFQELLVSMKSKAGVYVTSHKPEKGLYHE
jgi:hypothetical protein